jgi:hypothetical protein
MPEFSVGTIQEQAELVLRIFFQKFSLKSEEKSFGYTRSDDANVQTNVGWFFDFAYNLPVLGF